MAETAFRLLGGGDEWRKHLPERPVSENMMRWQKFYQDPCGCAPISHFGRHAILMFVCDVLKLSTVANCYKVKQHDSDRFPKSLLLGTSVQVDRCVVSLQIVHVLDVPTAGHPWLRFHPSVAFSAWNVRCYHQRAALTVDQNTVNSASPFQTCCTGINIFCWLMNVVSTKQWSDLWDLLRCIPSVQMTFHQKVGWAKMRPVEFAASNFLWMTQQLAMLDVPLAMAKELPMDSMVLWTPECFIMQNAEWAGSRRRKPTPTVASFPWPAKFALRRVKHQSGISQASVKQQRTWTMKNNDTS